VKLIDLVDFVFSKNAGPFVITFDSCFTDDRGYRAAIASGAFEPDNIAKMLKIDRSRVISVHPYDAARTLKFSITRDISSGTFGDRSVFGSQQWAPLLDVEIPVKAVS
jgi:hypothetical protein